MGGGGMRLKYVTITALPQIEIELSAEQSLSIESLLIIIGIQMSI